jgi:hypothetical protein
MKSAAKPFEIGALTLSPAHWYDWNFADGNKVTAWVTTQADWIRRAHETVGERIRELVSVASLAKTKFQTFLSDHAAEVERIWKWMIERDDWVSVDAWMSLFEQDTLLDMLDDGFLCSLIQLDRGATFVQMDRTVGWIDACCEGQRLEAVGRVLAMAVQYDDIQTVEYVLFQVLACAALDGIISHLDFGALLEYIKHQDNHGRLVPILQWYDLDWDGNDLLQLAEVGEQRRRIASTFRRHPERLAEMVDRYLASTQTYRVDCGRGYMSLMVAPRDEPGSDDERKSKYKCLDLWRAIAEDKHDLLRVLYKNSYPTDAVPVDPAVENGDWITYARTQQSLLASPPALASSPDTLMASMFSGRERVRGMPGKKGPRGGRVFSPGVQHMENKLFHGKMHIGQGKARHTANMHNAHDRAQAFAILYHQEHHDEVVARKRGKKK